jgi:hypothetical protein
MFEWIGIGLVLGGGIGYTAGALSRTALIGQLQEENAQLYREYSRVTDRDTRGRFTKRK